MSHDLTHLDRLCDRIEDASQAIHYAQHHQEQGNPPDWAECGATVCQRLAQRWLNRHGRAYLARVYSLPRMHPEAADLDRLIDDGRGVLADLLTELYSIARADFLGIPAAHRSGFDSYFRDSLERPIRATLRRRFIEWPRNRWFRFRSWVQYDLLRGLVWRLYRRLNSVPG